MNESIITYFLIAAIGGVAGALGMIFYLNMYKKFVLNWKPGKSPNNIGNIDIKGRYYQ